MSEHSFNFSIFVTKTLNAMGYKYHTIQQRRDCVKQAEKIGNGGFLADLGLTSMGAGSKREGVTPPMGGDNDTMVIFDEIICTEQVQLFENRDNLTIFEIDLEGCPPGYVLLKVARHGGRWCRRYLTDERARQELRRLLERNCWISDTGTAYMSSERFVNTMAKLLQYGMNANKDSLFPESIFAAATPSMQPRAGPSIPTCSQNSYVEASYDNVFAMKCQCPSAFDKFRNRPRRHGWPSTDLLEEISRLDAHVVPVGYKGSMDHFIEWRLCFTKAEIRLIECLTEPQTHVFVLLKIFGKDVLKQAWDAMTSYVMKNIILWMAELMPTHTFRTDTVMERFLDCLFFLKICFKTGNLPNYMISERNLLKLDQFMPKRRAVISLLNECLWEKGSCLLRSSRLKRALVKMHTAPDAMIKDGLERDRTEHAWMLYSIRLSQQVTMATSPQDIARLVMSGNAAEMIQLFQERSDEDEVADDPMGAIQKMLTTAFSHLR